MKIAIMGGWNIASGASIHSELLGRELAKNNELLVMSFYKNSHHGLGITREDEDYVVRCFTRSGVKKSKLDPLPFITEDYDIFIVEDLGMLPISLLTEIFPKIKKKAKTINVIHDGKISSKQGFYKLDWDAVVCFDERYKSFLKLKYPENKIHIIPYPSPPINTGNKEDIRKKLKLPKDKKIIFLFGRLAYYIKNCVPAINKIAEKYNILLLSVSNNYVNNQFEIGKKMKAVESKNYEIEIREEDLNIDELYQYLFASDALLYPKPSQAQVVVPSTIFQCLGSLCPIVACDSNFVDMFCDEIFKNLCFN